MYHLPYAKIYVQQHGLVFTPYLRFPVSPQINEMLFTMALLLYDDVLAQLIEFLMLFALALATVSFGQRLFSTQSGWWAGAILLSNPILIWLGTIAYVDVGVMLFMLMAIYAFRNWLEGKEQRWLALAGVFCGFGVGTKLLALFLPALFGIILISLALKDRKFSPPLIFGTVSFAVASPWLLRSLYYTGNPVFPFFHERLRWLLRGWHWIPINHNGLIENVSGHWDHVTLSRFLLLPWSLTFKNPFPSAPSAIFQVYFFALPLMIIAALSNNRMKWLLGIVLAYLIFWFCSVPDPRFIVPILPLLSVATAFAIEKSVNYFNFWKQFSRPALSLVGFVLFIIPGWVYAVRSLPGPLPPDRIPITAEQREAFLMKYMPSYGVYKFLNDRRGSNFTIYSLFNQNMTYYADGLFIAGLFAPGGYSSVFDGDPKHAKLIDGASLYKFLENLGTDYFLVETDKIEVKLPQDSFFRDHFKLIYEQPKLQLFEVSSANIDKGAFRD